MQKGDKITWKDGNRTMHGVIDQVYTRKDTSGGRMFYIRVAKRLFVRWLNL